MLKSVSSAELSKFCLYLTGLEMGQGGEDCIVNCNVSALSHWEGRLTRAKTRDRFEYYDYY